MVLKFVPPLSDHEQKIFLSLPKHNGSVIAPRYYPVNLRASAERELQQWCDSHDQADWPRWVMDWHILAKLERQQAERKASA